MGPAQPQNRREAQVLADNAGRKSRTESTEGQGLAGSVPFIRFAGSNLQPQSDSTAFARGHADSSIGG
jgi:hypothetical protein